MSHNPYTQAADAYGNTAKATTVNQRALEGQILLKAAQKLETLQKRLASGEVIPVMDVEDVLSYNRKLWTIFSSEAVNDENELPQDIKNNIASLSVFIFKRTVDLQADPTPDKLDALIDINRNIASGLMKAVENAEKEADSLKKQEQEQADMPEKAPIEKAAEPLANMEKTDMQT